MKLGLLLRTLPYLRWEQLVYRPWRVAQFRLYKAWPGLTARRYSADKASPQISPQTLATFQQVFEQWAHWRVPLAVQSARWAGLLEDRFTLLNHTEHLPQPDWQRRYVGHLWNYQFHYFDYAVWCARQWTEQGDARYWQRCQRLIEDWMAKTRPGQGDGWDAYPTSLRIVNWLYADCWLAGQPLDEAFQARWRASLATQLEFLSRHLEYHLLANHLLKNAKALVVGGLFFRGWPSAERWLTVGQQLLWQELKEQVLPDGGHYERTPMYHAQTLADWLECFALLQATDCLKGETAALTERLQAMAAFLTAVSYDDDTLALFNDSANTEETRPQPLLQTVAQVCGTASVEAPSNFPQTGYFVWQTPEVAEQIVVDAGPPSVTYNTAHAHCDLLSYELRFDGKPFIVDSGVHGYGDDPFREYCRATRAHNTVMFDGQEQSEVWGTFRMARRAEIVKAQAEGGTQTWQFQGAYRPYYNRNLIHQRLIERRADGVWVIRDTAQHDLPESSMAWRAVAESFIHLHPAILHVRQVQDDGLVIECQTDTRSILIEPFAASRVELIWGNQPLTSQVTSQVTAQAMSGVRLEATGATARAVQGWYFPTFGSAQPSPVICFHYQVQNGQPFGYTIKTLKRLAPVSDVPVHQ